MTGSVSRNGGRSLPLCADRDRADRRDRKNSRRRPAKGLLLFIRSADDLAAGLASLDEELIHARA